MTELDRILIRHLPDVLARFMANPAAYDHVLRCKVCGEDLHGTEELITLVCGGCAAARKTA